MFYFYFFLFRFFVFPFLFFSQHAAFPVFCSFYFFFLNVLIFTFFPSTTLFLSKRCISGALRSGMSYFQSFHFSIFSFPEAFFSQNAAFPEFCTLECLISKVFIFLFLASQKLFFRKTLHFRCSALWNVLFPKILFFFFFFVFFFYFFSLFFSFPMFFFFSILYFLSFLLSIFFFFKCFFLYFFLFPYTFFSQYAAFPEFCTLECLISKVFIFRFLA